MFPRRVADLKDVITRVIGNAFLKHMRKIAPMRRTLQTFQSCLCLLNVQCDRLF